MNAPRILEGVEEVSTYSTYRKFVDAFFQGHYQLLFVMGRPGLGKSKEFETHSSGKAHLIKGWTAPLQVFIDIFGHRDEPLVFDDAESLWKKEGGRILLRSLCEHQSPKQIQWLSTAKELAKTGVPQRFTTNSRVAIVANRFDFGNERERVAILDRGHLIYFNPSALEVHAQVADWFWDQEIYDFIGERLCALDDCSCRMYLKAAERKDAGDDWRKLVEEQFCHNTSRLLVQTLELDSSCRTVEERVAKFVRISGCCRATYFNFKRALKADKQIPLPVESPVPRRIVQGRPPTNAQNQPVDASATEGVTSLSLATGALDACSFQILV